MERKRKRENLPLWKVESLRNKIIGSYMIYMKYLQQNI